MITGAPKMGVTAFSGKTVPVPGMTVKRLQSSAIADPSSIVTGRSMR